MDSVDQAIALDPLTAYEVAIESLGDRRQPLMQAIAEEKAKDKPSQHFIRYCEMRLDALDELADELLLDDMGTIRRIFDRKAPFQVI